MFYSTRHFFKVAALLLAVSWVYTRLPDVLEGIRRVWAYLDRFFSRPALDEAVSAVYTALYGFINPKK
jgi:hypothetical protein